MNKQQLTKKEVEHIADLSKIHLTSKELEAYSKDLSVIIDSADNLQELNTDNTEITTHTTGLTNVTRKDKPEKSLSRQEVLKNANKTLQGYFVVKRVIEK
jgi:aspartyl-tRNA(Asn)/glutamyl-tRNA(Gln) amidotransferase subunit C